jgi:hypothetical protein
MRELSLPTGANVARCDSPRIICNRTGLGKVNPLQNGGSIILNASIAGSSGMEAFSVYSELTVDGGKSQV